jgi:competence protein ComGF
MALRNNEAGFTLISLLLSLMILVITLPLLIFFLSQIQAEPDDEHIRAHQFFIFIVGDMERAESVYIAENMLYFNLTTGDTARIEQYQDQIRRRVREMDKKTFEGHEIYLRDIQSVYFAPLSYGFQVTLKMESGETYEKKIAY